MISLFLELSKYVIVIIMAFYVSSAFIALKRRDDDFRRGIYIWLEFLALSFFTLGISNVLVNHVKTENYDQMWPVALLAIQRVLRSTMIKRIMRNSSSRMETPR